MIEHSQDLGVDPRAVANLLLETKRNNHKLTNLALQKIIYFLHGQYLTQSGKPLVAGYFIGWEFGPVHPVVYSAFKNFGSNEITVPAQRRDLLTGEMKAIAPINDTDEGNFVIDNGHNFLKYSAARLVELSHAAGSPWDIATKTESQKRLWGARIDNKTITERFRFHKISIGPTPPLGVPNHETPPT